MDVTRFKCHVLKNCDQTHNNSRVMRLACHVVPECHGRVTHCSVQTFARHALAGISLIQVIERQERRYRLALHFDLSYASIWYRSLYMLLRNVVHRRDILTCLSPIWHRLSYTLLTKVVRRHDILTLTPIWHRPSPAVICKPDIFWLVSWSIEDWRANVTFNNNTSVWHSSLSLFSWVNLWIWLTRRRRWLDRETNDLRMFAMTSSITNFVLLDLS